MIQNSSNKYIRFVIDPVVGGAIVAGASSLLGSGISAMQNAKSYSRWRRSFDHAHRANIEDWNMQNEYNLPLNQLKRLRDAGINPNFAMQSGGITAQGGSISPASGSDLSQIDLGSKVQDGLSQGIEMMNALTQQKNLKASTAKLEAETENVEEDTQTKRINNALEGVYGAKERVARIGNIEMSTKQMASLLRPTIKSLLAKFHLDNVTAQRLEELLPGELSQQVADTLNTESATRLNDANADKSKSEKKLVETQNRLAPRETAAHERQAEASIMSAQASQVSARAAEKAATAQAAASRALIPVYGEQAKNISADTIKQYLENGLNAWAYRTGKSKERYNAENYNYAVQGAKDYEVWRRDHADNDVIDWVEGYIHDHPFSDINSNDKRVNNNVRKRKNYVQY